MPQPAIHIKSIPPTLAPVAGQLGPYKKGDAYVVPVDIALQILESVRPHSSMFGILGIPPLPAKGEMTAQAAVKWLCDSKFDAALLDE